MSSLSDKLIFAIRSKKQTHFDSVLEDMRQWHHTNGGFVDKEFAQEIVDVFDYTIKSNYRDLLNTGIELLAHWIAHCATEDVANKLFDVVNNPWLVRALLTAVDDPRMLEKCNLEDVLYNQTGVIRRRITTDDLMVFVKLPAPKCIQYVFSDPFVLKALNQEEQADKNNRLGENDHIFWSLTDPDVTHALSSVLDSLLSHPQTRWVRYYMTAVCKRGSLNAFNKLTQHPKFTSLHLHEIESFFSQPIDFQVNVVNFISQMSPCSLSLQARSSHIAALISHTHLSSHLDERRKEIYLLVDGLEQPERIEVHCQAIIKCHARNTTRRDPSQKDELSFRSFSSLVETMDSADLDGLLHHLPHNILNVVRAHPMMQQRILHSEVAALSDNSVGHKRKI